MLDIFFDVVANILAFVMTLCALRRGFGALDSIAKASEPDVAKVLGAATCVYILFTIAEWAQKAAGWWQ